MTLDFDQRKFEHQLKDTAIPRFWIAPTYASKNGRFGVPASAGGNRLKAELRTDDGMKFVSDGRDSTQPCCAALCCSDFEPSLAPPSLDSNLRPVCPSRIEIGDGVTM
jgi:hypothetical protein